MAALAILSAGGCGLLEPGEADRIPGRYRMATYDGRALPVIVRGEAAGDRVELLSAEMEVRRNFIWVITRQVDTVDARGRRSAVVADSGVFRFGTAAGELTFFAVDGQHPATRSGDTIDVFWMRTRHEVFVR